MINVRDTISHAKCNTNSFSYSSYKLKLHQIKVHLFHYRLNLPIVEALGNYNAGHAWSLLLVMSLKYWFLRGFQLFGIPKKYCV